MPIDPAQAVALLASIQWSRDLEKMSKTLAARFEREMKEVPLPLPCCAASPSVRSSDGLLQTTLKLTKLAETQDALHTDVNRKLAKLEGRLASASSDTQLAKVPMSVLDFADRFLPGKRSIRYTRIVKVKAEYAEAFNKAQEKYATKMTEMAQELLHPAETLPSVMLEQWEKASPPNPSRPIPSLAHSHCNPAGAISDVVVSQGCAA